MYQDFFDGKVAHSVLDSLDIPLKLANKRFDKTRVELKYKQAMYGRAWRVYRMHRRVDVTTPKPSLASKRSNRVSKVR